MQRPGPNGNDLIPQAAGTGALPAGVTLKSEPNKAGYTLSTGVTYYYDLGPGTKESPYQAVHVKWDAACALTISIEDTCFDNVMAYSTTTGEWEHEDPSTAYIAHDGNSTVTNSTVTVSAGAVGGCVIHFSQMGSLKSRLKIVATTGGVVRVAMGAKD